MSNPNLDSRYTKPADVDAKIAAQAVTDAGQYLRLPAGFVGSTAARRAMFPISMAGLGNGGIGVWTEAHQRQVVKIPVTPTRWRLCIGNLDSSGSQQAGAVNFTGLWIGTPTLGSDGKPNGQFTSTPTQVTASFSTPADGSLYTSGWFNTPLNAQTSYLLSYGWTTSATNRTVGNTKAWFTYGAGKSTDASTLNPSGLASSNGCNFQAWIEYEFIGTNPIGLAIGDSITEGYHPDNNGLNNDQVWPSIYSERANSPLCVTAWAGTTVAQWVNASAWNIQRIATRGLTIDYAIIYLGSNDANNGVALSTYQTNMASLVNIVRNTLSIKQIYFGTVTPRNILHGPLAAATSSGSTTLTLSSISGGTISNGATLTIGTGFLQETKTVSSVSGNTITLTVGTTNNHLAGEQVMSSNEATRRAINAYLRTKPFDAAGVFEFETAVAYTYDSGILDPTYSSSDNTHMRAEGQQRLADSVHGILRQP